MKQRVLTTMLCLKSTRQTAEVTDSSYGIVVEVVVLDTLFGSAYQRCEC
jgi:hypothetical protein